MFSTALKFKYNVSEVQYSILKLENKVGSTVQYTQTRKQGEAARPLKKGTFSKGAQKLTLYDMPRFRICLDKTHL